MNCRLNHSIIIRKKGREYDEKKDLRNKSKVFSEGPIKAPNRAMLRAVGVTDGDFKKPMVGVASTWSEVTPCNIHLNDLAKRAKKKEQEKLGLFHSCLTRLPFLTGYRWGQMECAIHYQVVM